MNQENVEEEEEEEQDNADFFECDEAKKDRSKDNKFKALLSEGSLPDYVAQAWKKTLSMKKGRTEEQRKIVNQVLDRTKDGKLMVNLEKPLFAQMRDLDEKLPCRQQALGGNQGGQSQVQAPVAPQEKNA